MSVTASQQYDVVIVGGGNAGISLAAYLLRKDPALDVALVAPESEHRYRPLLSYVGGGMSRLGRTVRPQASVIPDGCHWYQEWVTDISPGDGSHRVTTSAGRILTAPDVVLCPGATIDWEAIPGSEEACNSAHASTNYEPELAPTTWRMLKRLTSGDAVFAISNRNTPCPGVGLKPLFLAADLWQRTGRMKDIRITVVLEDDTLFGLAKVDDRLHAELERLGATVLTGAHLDSVDADARRLHVTDRDGRSRALPYDAMHLTPPYRGHDWVVRSGVTDPTTTLIANDPETLAHPDHPGLWALGDAATLLTSSSGGGLRRQVPVVGDNIRARREGGEYARYDGYTVAPIPVSRRSLLLAERDRRGREQRSLPLISLAKPRAATLWFDLIVQPPIYWHRLLKGKVSR